MMKLTIQRATLDDAKQLSEMGYASYRHHFGHLWESQTELAAFLKQEYAPQAIADSLMQPGTYWLIASAQMPVGFAKFSTQQTIEPEGCRVRSCINSIYCRMPRDTATASNSLRK